MISWVLVHIVLSMFLLHCSESKDEYDTIHKYMKCGQFDRDLLENVTCRFRKFNWKKGTFSADFHVKPHIQITNLVFKVTLYRRGTNMEYRVFGPNEVSFDFCSFLSGTFSHAGAVWMNSYIKRISKENNVFQPCPLSGHIYLHGLVFDENSYSGFSFIPEGDYICRSRMMTQYNNSEHLLVEVKSHTQIKSLEMD